MRVLRGIANFYGRHIKSLKLLEELLEDVLCFRLEDSYRSRKVNTLSAGCDSG